MQLSVTEYAAQNNITRQAVIKRIKTGKFGKKAKKIGHTYVIFVDKKA
jgi:predicted DNA-binding protein YlxM (UPF0122 family)